MTDPYMGMAWELDPEKGDPSRFDKNGIAQATEGVVPEEGKAPEIPQLTPDAFLDLAGQIYSRLAADVREAHSLLETLRVLKAEGKRARKRAQRRKAAAFRQAVAEAYLDVSKNDPDLKAQMELAL